MQIHKCSYPALLVTEGIEPSLAWEEGTCELRIGRSRTPPFIVPGWENTMPQLVQDWQDTILSIWQWTSKIEVLTQEVLLLKGRIEYLEAEAPTIVPIESLSPEPYDIYKPIHAVVRKQGDEYIATFYDANLSASGDTDTEAIYNLKDIIVGSFEILSSHERTDLTPGPARQLDVLESFIRITI